LKISFIQIRAFCLTCPEKRYRSTDQGQRKLKYKSSRESDIFIIFNGKNISFYAEICFHHRTVAFSFTFVLLELRSDCRLSFTLYRSDTCLTSKFVPHPA